MLGPFRQQRKMRAGIILKVQLNKHVSAAMRGKSGENWLSRIDPRGGGNMNEIRFPMSTRKKFHLSPKLLNSVRKTLYLRAE